MLYKEKGLLELEVDDLRHKHGVTWDQITLN